MFDPANLGEPNGNGNGEVVRMEILMNTANPLHVQVSGPLMNKLMCFHMLSLSFEAVTRFDIEKQSKGNIVAAPANVLEQLK